GELAIAATVDPSDCAGVPAALHAFELVDQLIRRLARPAADRGRRMQRGRELKRGGGGLAQRGLDARREVLDVGEANDLWPVRSDMRRERSQRIDYELRREAMFVCVLD